MFGVFVCVLVHMVRKHPSFLIVNNILHFWLINCNKYLSRTCNIFPTVNVAGTLKHLQLLPHELQQYEEQLERVLRRYLKRLQWLLSGTFSSSIIAVNLNYQWLQYT